MPFSALGPEEFGKVGSHSRWAPSNNHTFIKRSWKLLASQSWRVFSKSTTRCSFNINSCRSWHIWIALSRQLFHVTPKNEIFFCIFSIFCIKSQERLYWYPINFWLQFSFPKRHLLIVYENFKHTDIFLPRQFFKII